jgi:hypothetical protein
MRFLVVLFVVFVTSTTWIQAQDEATQQVWPPVINVAQNSAALDALSNTYQSSLFSASNADFRETVNNWSIFLRSMEQYAEEIDFDIKGVKVWMKVFWAKDGSVNHLAYALSDRSININLTEWEAFLRSFIRNRKMALQHSKGFTYDGRIMFPLSYQRPK